MKQLFVFLFGSELEAILLVTGALDIPNRPSPKHSRGDEDEDSSEGELSSDKMRRSGVPTRHQKNVRSSGRKEGDDDSDFEFDL